MKRRGLVVIIMVIVFFSLGAADAVQSDYETFMNELSFHLRERGWNTAEIEQLQEQARLLQWEDGRFADPAMIAYALHHGAHESVDATKEMAMIRAQAALEVAAESRALIRLGYGQQAVAQAAARGIRDVVSQSRQQDQKDEKGPTNAHLGETIRNEVRNEVSKGQTSTTRNSIGAEKKAAAQAGQAGSPSANRPNHSGGPSR